MKHILSIFLATILCATSSAQTIKTLGVNTTNGEVVASTTNALHFTNAQLKFNVGDLSLSNSTFYWGTNPVWSPEDNSFDSALSFNGTNAAPTTRANLGFSTNLNTLWTATNASNARSAVGLGQTNSVLFEQIQGTFLEVDYFAVIGTNNSSIINLTIAGTNGIQFNESEAIATTRTNLGLGETNDPTFRDVSVRDLQIVGGSGGKIVYPQTNSAPSNTTNAAAWIQLNVGTNSYRVPLYQ